jgi:putative salt-induced outer membrane protein YdiY
MDQKRKYLPGLILLACCWTLGLAQGPDSLRTKSGELLSGELQSLSKEVLVFETSYSDTDFRIEWEEVDWISTTVNFKIYDTDGTLFIGKLGPGSDCPDCLLIFTSNDTIIRKFTDISVITEAQESFKDRVKLGIHLGYHYTKASSTQQFTTRSSAGYIGDKWDITSAFNAHASRLDSSSTSRIDANINLRLSLQNNWYGFGNINWLSSDEQKLKLRTTASTGVGNFVVRTSDSHLYLFGGLTFNNEDFFGEEGTESQSFEGLAGGQLELFGFNDISLDSKLYAYPSITEKQRIRTMFSLDLTWEFISDFDLIAGFSLNYDSKPPGNTEKSDYVFSLTLGWSL